MEIQTLLHLYYSNLLRYYRNKKKKNRNNGLLYFTKLYYFFLLENFDTSIIDIVLINKKKIETNLSYRKFRLLGGKENKNNLTNFS